MEMSWKGHEKLVGESWKSNGKSGKNLEHLFEIHGKYWIIMGFSSNFWFSLLFHGRGRLGPNPASLSNEVKSSTVIQFQHFSNCNWLGVAAY